MISDYTLAVQLPIVIILGILLFDLYLLTIKKTTISRAIWRTSVGHPWYAIIAASLICYLIGHLWGVLP